jgi:hypothetical protein
VQGYKDKFAVDKDRGYITLQQLLDTEDVGKVILTVGASDHGKILIYSMSVIRMHNFSDDGH